MSGKSRKRKKNRKPHQKQRLAHARQAAADAAQRAPVSAGSLAVQMEPEEHEHVPDPTPEPYRLPVEFAVEDFRASAAEATPLIRAHAEELGLLELPWEFKPALNTVAKLCEMGAGVWFTAREREAGNLVGYALYFLSPWLLSRDNWAASREWIYLAPAYRARGLLPLGFRFLTFCDNEMKSRGAAMIEQRAMLGTGFGRVLEKAGYQPIEDVYWKNTGQEA